MGLREETFLRDKFRDYYRSHEVKGPPQVKSREFGIGAPGKKIFQRHLSFSNPAELNAFLRKEVPFYISYSNAYYEFPAGRPMETKKMQSADLLYEFDADDIKTNCKEEHDLWKCESCNASGKGAIEKCTKCGESVSVDQWFCSECLGETKKQVFQLLKILADDFGFEEGISINFSGNAGYHIHVRSEKVKSLSQDARVELANYLTATNLNPATYCFIEEGKTIKCPLPDDAMGMPKRMVDELLDLIEKGDSQKIASLGGISHKNAQQLLSQKKLVLKKITDEGVLLSVPGSAKKNSTFWNSIFQYLAQEIALKIDRQVSIDAHRIIRVPDTIHGGTGLLAKEISLDSLENFNPLDETVVFGKTAVKVFINKAPRFMLGGKEFGPFTEEEISLPEYAAIYLFAKGKAVLK